MISKPTGFLGVALALLAQPALTAQNRATSGEPTKQQVALIEQCEAAEHQFDRHGFVLHDAPLDAHLAAVARPLLPETAPDYIAWRFLTLRDPLITAFGLPDGTIYLSTGMLARLENDDQLAGVLGHEITHVARGDIFSVWSHYQNKERARNISALIMFTPTLRPAGAGEVAAAV